MHACISAYAVDSDKSIEKKKITKKKKTKLN